MSAPPGESEAAIAASAHSAEERLQRIEAVTDAALSKLDIEELLPELLDRIRELLATDTSTVLLLEESSQLLVATAASTIEEEVTDAVGVPLGRGFAGRIAAERRPIILQQVDATNVVNPLVAEQGDPLDARRSVAQR